MAMCWGWVLSPGLFACVFFYLFFYFSAVFIVGVPFPFSVWGRMWNSLLSVPDHCLFIYLENS